MAFSLHVSPPAPFLMLLAAGTGFFLLLQYYSCSAQSGLCRTTCGDVHIHYPFGIDDGCGSTYYSNLLVCDAPTPPSTAPRLRLRTPSGTYPVLNISYSDPHLVISDPSMWSCDDVDGLGSTIFRCPGRPPFSLDASTRLSLSPKNDYIFFNCSRDDVIAEDGAFTSRATT